MGPKKDKKNLSKQGDVIVKSLVKQVISKELQDYYDQVISIVKGEDRELMDTVLKKMSQDPAAVPLVPYFVQFVSDMVKAAAKQKGLLLTHSHF